MARTLLLMCLLLTTGAAAQAKQCRGVDFPDHIQLAGNNLTLNGLGVRKATFLKINVYVAALYVIRPATDPRVLVESSEPQELLLHFVRGVGLDDLRKAWSEGFARNASGQLAALNERVARLNSWMTDIKAGQRLTFIRRPGAGVQVEVNGTVKGTIEGDDFSRAFMSIWLGAVPPNPEVKTGLLGGECG